MAELLAELRSWLDAHPWLEVPAGLAALALLAYLADVAVKRVVITTLDRLTRLSPFAWDDALHRHRVFARLAYLAPLAVIYFGIPVLPGVPAVVVGGVHRAVGGATALVVAMAVAGVLSAINDIYERESPLARSRPIKGYLQVVKLFLYLIAVVVAVAGVLDKSPTLLLSGIGALTAVLLLVFRDTILSLVASVQLATHDMIRVGDWIEMPQYGADGDVIDIALHTVKVQNWDKTITTIPTHKLIEDSFKNWRGMSESGGRRIARALHLDTGTIRFLSDEEIDDCRRFAILHDYLDRKLADLREDNARRGATAAGDVNARRLTNVGTFRAYVAAYLQHHPKLRRDMTMMVRQLAPTPEGLPLQIYTFTGTTVWAEYEGIQADIFDHLIAILPTFGLRLYQRPSGADLAAAAAGESWRAGGLES